MALPERGTGWEPCDIDLFSPWQQQIKTRSKTEGRLLDRKAAWPVFHKHLFLSSTQFSPLSQISYKSQSKNSTEPFGHDGTQTPTVGRGRLAQPLLKHQTRFMEKSQTTMLGNFICWLSIHIFGKCVWTWQRPECFVFVALQVNTPRHCQPRLHTEDSSLCTSPSSQHQEKNNFCFCRLNKTTSLGF